MPKDIPASRYLLAHRHLQKMATDFNRCWQNGPLTTTNNGRQWDTKPTNAQRAAIERVEVWCLATSLILGCGHYDIFLAMKNCHVAGAMWERETFESDLATATLDRLGYGRSHAAASSGEPDTADGPLTDA